MALHTLVILSRNPWAYHRSHDNIYRYCLLFFLVQYCCKDNTAILLTLIVVLNPIYIFLFGYYVACLYKRFCNGLFLSLFFISTINFSYFYFWLQSEKEWCGVPQLSFPAFSCSVWLTLIILFSILCTYLWSQFFTYFHKFLPFIHADGTYLHIYFWVARSF